PLCPYTLLSHCTASFETIPSGLSLYTDLLQSHLQRAFHKYPSPLPQPNNAGLPEPHEYVSPYIAHKKTEEAPISKSLLRLWPSGHPQTPGFPLSIPDRGPSPSPAHPIFRENRRFY